MSRGRTRNATRYEGASTLTDRASPQPDNPEVLALIGPSGTGKSHRASIVAEEIGAEAILDDGLLIAGGKILAGHSAKREPTRVAATRRALLHDPAHAAEIRAKLAEVAPGCLLILGISRGMVEQIAKNLGLPKPERIFTIEEFASPRQMRKAVHIRKSEGKHVIPAPTLEVRKSFSGYPVDPLQVFLRPRSPRRDQRPPATPVGPGYDDSAVLGQFIEKSVVRPTWSSLGRFYIEDVVVAAIAARAALEIPGVGRVLESRVQPVEGGVAVELTIGTRYGFHINEAASQVRRQVAEIIEHMTALNCERVDVKVGTVVADRPGGYRSGDGHK